MVCALTAAALLTGMSLHAADDALVFQEIYSLVRSNLAGVTPMELDKAALDGLLDQLQGQAMIVTNTPASTESGTNSTMIAVKKVYDDSFVYLRFTSVEKDAATAFTNALQSLTSTNKLKGLVVDLRNARGQDYDAAVAVADLFLSEAKPLLEIGDKTYSSTAKANALALPLAVLVNHQTSGSSEALASLLRRNKAGLVLGSATAGEAVIFKNFTLSNGQTLRIAINRVKLGEGPALSLKGVRPDIAIQVDADDEKAYLKDAYATITHTTGGTSGSATDVAVASTNKPSRRMINEAELVRMHKEGQNIDDDTTTAPKPNTDAEKPLVHDPVLSRALDLLKGLAVVKEYRR